MNTKETKIIILSKLNPDDYHLWAVQATSTFIVRKVWSIVDGSEPSPQPLPGLNGIVPAINPTLRQKITKWNENHALALQALLNCLDKPSLTRVIHLKSANSIWVTLAKEHGYVSNIKRGEAQTAFHSLSKDTNIPMKDHIDRFVQLQQQVDYHRPPDVDPMSNTEVNLSFIRSLGESWRTFHQSINNELPTMPTSDLFARVKVLAYTPPETPAPVIPTAQVTEHQKEKNKSNRGGRKGKRGAYKGSNSNPNYLGSNFNPNYRGRGGFSRGGGRGGFQGFQSNRNSYNQQNQNQRTFPRTNDAFCRYCKNPGHTIDQCEKKKRSDERNEGNNTFTGNTGNTNLTNRIQQDDHPPWMAQVTIVPTVASTTSPTPFTWILDSAANTFIMPYKWRFIDYEAFPRTSIVKGLGGKTVRALGQGTILLTNMDNQTYNLTNVLYVPDAENPVMSMMKLRRQNFNVEWSETNVFTL
jgi:hypothetical protein